jgi:hypothetical protein
MVGPPWCDLSMVMVNMATRCVFRAFIKPSSLMRLASHRCPARRPGSANLRRPWSQVAQGRSGGQDLRAPHTTISPDPQTMQEEHEKSLQGEPIDMQAHHSRK